MSKKQENKKMNVGDVVRYGMYTQDYDDAFAQFIEWIVLEKKDGKALLLSKYALACKPYNDEKKPVTWETCSLRNWLNEDFLNNVEFTGESVLIQTTTVPADKNPTSLSSAPGNDTQDKVFILSAEEVERYLPKAEDRVCEMTPFALIHSGYPEDETNFQHGWWLRTPGFDSPDRPGYNAANVSENGEIHLPGDGVDLNLFGVRPALWIDLSMSNYAED